MKQAEKWLIFWLRLSAVVLLLALVAVFLPFRWMAEINNALGFETLPDTPLVNYLTRSLSAVYALLGVLTWVLSRDVRRYGPLILCVGVAYLVFGASLVVLDFTIDMPLLWALLEGPIVIVTGAIQLWLLKQIETGQGSA
jgi:hypothetical protein